MSPKWIRLIQTGSPIRRHYSQRATLIGLGLNRIGRFRMVLDTPQTRGMIRKVKHLVRVLDGPLLGELTSIIKAQLETLSRFNRRVDRIEQSGFWKRYANEEPHVISRMQDMTTVLTSDTSFAMTGRIHSILKNFSQDEIGAFILDYRQFTQNNDPISIGNLSKIYSNDWVPPGAREAFEDARAKLNARLQAPTTIMFGERTLLLSTLVDVVVYGGLAHANPEKAATFEDWEKSGVMGFIWAEFFAHLRGLVATLQYFRMLNSQILAMAHPPKDSLSSSLARS